MKRLPARVSVAAVLATLMIGSVVYAAGRAAESVSVPAAKLRFAKTGIANSGGEVLVAPAFGSLAKGPHASFIKIPGGFDSGTHTHTGDYYATVIAGTVVNGPPGTPEIRMGPGSYWLQRGREPHITKCVSRTPCVFFVNQTRKFDFLAEGN